MSWLEIKGLNEEYQKITTDARALLEGAKKSEKRDLTLEENNKFDAMMADAEKIKARVEQLRKLEDAEKSVETRLGREEFNVGPRSEEAQEKRNKAFVKWLRKGNDGLTSEDRSILSENRAVSGMSTTSSGHGSEWVPTSFFEKVTNKLVAFGGIREAGATVLSVPSGEAITFPVSADGANKGEIVAQGSAVTDDNTYDPVSSSRSVQPYLYNSKVVRVSLQLLNSAVFDVESHIAGLLAERIFRATNEHFTTGDGSSKPYGITAGSSGKTAADNTSTTFAEILDLKHSVDPSYRNNARFMFNDATLLALKKLTDSEGRNLWAAGNLALNIPATIDGTPYVVNQDCASMGNSAKALFYGDFSRYYIVDVTNFEVFRLNELYMGTLEVGFIAKSSHGGNLIDTTAIKYMTMAAS